MDPEMNPAPGPHQPACEAVSSDGCAESHTLLHPAPAVTDLPQHELPHMHAEHACAAHTPRATMTPTTDSGPLTRVQVPATMLEASTARSTALGDREVATAGSFRAGDSASPSVNGEWETQCRGLSSRRRR